MWAFLPSKSQWAYTVLVQNVPILHPEIGVQRVIIINSDVDKQETRAIAGTVGLIRGEIITQMQWLVATSKREIFSFLILTQPYLCI